MSSPLAGAACIAIDGAVVAIRVDSAEQFTFPFSDVFALLLIHEPFMIDPVDTALLPWPEPITGPLDAALRHSVDHALASSSDPEAARQRQLLAESPIEAILALAGGDTPILPASAIASRFVRAAGYADPRRFELPPGFEADPDGMYRPRKWWLTDEERLAYLGALDRVHSALRAGADPGTACFSATLLIKATDPKWLEHLRVGMLWDSYVFDDAAPFFPA